MLEYFTKLAREEGFWNCPAWVKQMEIIGWNIAQHMSHKKAFEVWSLYAPYDQRKFSEFFKDNGVTPEELTQDEKRVISEKRGIGTKFGKPNFNPMWEWHFVRPETSKLSIKKYQEKQRAKQAELDKLNLPKTMPPQRYWGD